MNFYIITPHGGSESELFATLESVKLIARRNMGVQFRHIVIFNNAVASLELPKNFSENLHVQYEDINPIASRAKARNLGLDILQDQAEGYVLFLDSGDLLERGGLNDFFGGEDLIVHSTLVMSDTSQYTRKAIHHSKKYICNPFYLGSVYLRKSLACNYRFQEGRKEDWKFWIEIIENNPSIQYNSNVSYIYMITSKGTHFKRKIKLFKDQFLFYYNYLGFGVLRSVFYLVSHYIYQAYNWVVLIR